MVPRTRPSVRATAIVLCASLVTTVYRSNAWTTERFSSPRLYKSRLFLTNEGHSSLPRKNPNPIMTRRRHALDMASSSSTMTEPRTRRRSKQTSVELQRRELTNHEIMTRQEELELGAKIVRANQLKQSMAAILEEKTASLEQEIFKQVYGNRELLSQEDLLALTEHQEDLDDLTSNLCFISPAEEEALFDPDGMPSSMSAEELSAENHFQNQREGRLTELCDLDDMVLSDEDIVVRLGLPGGREELRRILLEGAFAREKLIRNNVRLVVNIAKRWARQSAKYNNEDGASLVSIYEGNAYRPSLDEAVQEGILGLARAADRYDPSRGLRFSTYSTFWVTNFVRNCFRSASTGILRVPAHLHLTKNQHNILVKKYYDTMKEIPPDDVLAKELGVTVNRLRTALHVTQGLLSIDSVLSGPITGGKAGSDSMGEPELLISDTLQCTEAPPEDHVELSFLRQCLENAMAAELSPHERDVLRLRLGLDDGVSRTVKEVVEICGGNLSMSEVRLAEQRAYKKLRAPYSLAKHYQLIAFLDFAGIDQSTMKHV